MLKNMRGTPGQPDPSEPGSRIPVSITMPVTEVIPVVRMPEAKGRQIYFKEEDFEAHGYTDGCDGCDARRAGMPLRAHSDTCRARLTAALRSERNPRYLKAKERGGVEPTEPEPTEPRIQGEASGSAAARESPPEDTNQDKVHEEPEAENDRKMDLDKDEEEAKDTAADMPVPSDTDSDKAIMRQSVKQKIDKYEAKVERHSKKQATDRARSSAAGLGQELHPGKRGTVEEAAEAAATTVSYTHLTLPTKRIV